jgi:ATP-dependent helicase/nuclease subunit B
MMRSRFSIPPSEKFWTVAAGRLVAYANSMVSSENYLDLSRLRVLVPTFDHAQQLREALVGVVGQNFVPPRISTLSSFLELQAPTGRGSSVDNVSNERLMSLYAELRQHGWLKKLFGAKRNTDLLPLTQTILALIDELTTALLPEMDIVQDAPDVDQRWDRALAQLPLSARSLFSHESELVWSIWKAQLDLDDPGALRYRSMVDLAKRAAVPLVWISPIDPAPFDHAFLAIWARRQPVLVMSLDWQSDSFDKDVAGAWPEILEPDSFANENETPISGSVEFVERNVVHPVSAKLSLCPATSLEEEAQHGAQTIVNWLQDGKKAIAIVAQDRVVARRIRALLQRAQIEVNDETGWKLSTTRAAATLVAWFDVVTSRAETTVLLDFLKSSFFLAENHRKAAILMQIETALRRQNIAGGWSSVMAALPAGPQREVIQNLATCSVRFEGRFSIDHWMRLTFDALHEFGIRAAFSIDAAGIQVDRLLCAIDRSAIGMPHEFSFSEWRAFVCLQLETTTFLPPVVDRRVVMLPLNGMHLRHFDAVLMVGADAAHLPSRATETLFFANGVRRELGLSTRESQQRQQLRDFAEMLSSNPKIVLSWQSTKEGDPNPVSPWIARLELYRRLNHGGLSMVVASPPFRSLSMHCVALTSTSLRSSVPVMPAPLAARLLPEKLSASGYASLSACPYQFFATRMLRLSDPGQISDQPEKRDYGNWLHQILYRYEVALRDQPVAAEQRQVLLSEVTTQIFDLELVKSGAALGYLDRWQKAIPAYLKWASARETEGWHFSSGEDSLEHTLAWPGGGILLHGRIDRIDRSENVDRGELAVLDYKTTTVSVLKKRLKDNEDHQLAFYGLLSASAATEGVYVGLEPASEKIVGLSVPDYANRIAELRARITADFSAIAQDAPLPATGIDATCRYCAMNGLCRKGAW